MLSPVNLCNQELISIVVPIYNVSEYLDKCIQSIINQTYKNIEIILVNDGATDDSGLICTRYAEIDSRIVYIEKKNGGLSDARNVGIKLAKGKYLTFVDSDDFVENNMCEVLYSAVVNAKTDIGCSGYYVDGDNGVISEYHEFMDEIKTISRDEALKLIFFGRSYAAWGKIYKRKLFDKLEFPKGKIDEDYAVMYKLFGSVEQITFVNNHLYHYLKRSGSITKSEFNIAKLDFVNNAYDAMNYAQNHFTQELYHLAKRFYLFRVRMVVHMMVRADIPKIYETKIKELSTILKNNLLFLLFRTDITYKDKVVFVLDSFCPKLYSATLKKQLFSML